MRITNGNGEIMNSTKLQHVLLSLKLRCQQHCRWIILLTIGILLIPAAWFGFRKFQAIHTVKLTGREGVDALKGKATVYFRGDNYIGYDTLPIQRPPGPIDDALVEGVAGMNNLIDADMVHLRKMPNLGILDLTATSITGKGLEYIRDARTLRVLWLPRSTTDVDLEPLSSLKHVADLNLSYSKVTDDGLRHLSGLTGLWRLQLTRTKVTDAGLKYLAGLQNLQELWLEETDVTDAGLADLKGLDKLQDLLLTQTKVADAGLVNLKQLKNLRELFLDYTLVHGDGLVHLQSLEHLEELRLGGNDVGDASLKYIGNMSSLKNLCLDGTQITNIGLDHLLGLTHLEFVTFMDTKVTKEGADKLQKAFPKCRVQYGNLLR